MLEIECKNSTNGPELATGAVVDDDGLIITADHALRGIDAVPQHKYSPGPACELQAIRVHFTDGSVISTSAFHGDKVLYGAPKQGGIGVDVAFIRIAVPPETQRHIRPLDIAVDDPAQGSGYWIPGPDCSRRRPSTANQTEITSDCFTLRTTPVTIERNTLGAEMYVGTGQMAAGFSGGPLLNASNRVVGIDSWGETETLSVKVNQAYFTPVKFFMRKSPLPPSAILADHKEACNLVLSSEFVTTTFFTLQQVLRTFTSLSGDDKAACTCCCAVLRKYPHVPDLSALPKLTCEPDSICPEISFLRAVASWDLHPSVAAPQMAASLSFIQHEQKFNSDPFKLASYQGTFGEFAAKQFTASLAPTSLTTNNSVEHSLVTSGMWALKRSADISPSSEKYNVLANALHVSGHREGSIAAFALESTPPRDSLVWAKLNELLEQALSSETNQQLVRRETFGGITISSSILADHGAYVHVTDPECAKDVDAHVRLMQEAVAAHSTTLNNYVGPLTDLSGNPVTPNASDLASALRSQVMYPEHSQCVIVAALIPKHSQIISYQLHARELTGEIDDSCNGIDFNCNVGWSKWIKAPSILHTESADIAFAVFKNWSHDRSRIATMQLTLSDQNVPNPQ